MKALIIAIVHLRSPKFSSRSPPHSLRSVSPPRRTVPV